MRATGIVSFAVLAGSCAALLACSSRPTDLPSGGAGPLAGGSSASAPLATDGVGTIGVALQVAAGITIDSASYTLTGPNAFSQSGMIGVSSSPTISALLGGIPVASGYTISLTAVSTDGSVQCAGTSAPFAVLSNQTTPVPVAVACSGPTPEAGAIVVTATANQCPTIDAIGVNPANVFVGSSLALVGLARGPNSAALTFVWTATSGSFSNPTSSVTAFTCTTAGAPTITLTVWDGSDAAGCVAVQSVTVTCT